MKEPLARNCMGCCVACLLLLFASISPLQAQTALLLSPHWSIEPDDFGYADFALDQRPGFEGREYLSGEWAAAIAYTRNSVTNGPNWLNPEFFFPDWTPTASGFFSEMPIGQTGTNAFGFERFRSIISDGTVRIAIDSEMIDTTNGIPVGLAPASGSTGASLLSDRYVFRQQFSITNISGETLTNIQFFKFLHSLETKSAVYDDRDYGPAVNGHHYVISQQGKDTGIQLPSGVPVVHYDTISLHANIAPSAWEVGYYGIEGIDSHVVDKPATGVHLSVEANALTNSDRFVPPTKWVSGAVRCELGALEAGASTNIEFLMTIHTVTTGLPLKIRKSGSNVIISWPVGSLDSESYYLETTSSLTNPNWTWLLQTIHVANGENYVTIPIGPNAAFYRMSEFDIY